MSSLHFRKDKRPGKGNNNGFYIALGVCLIAIGVAAWTTYDSVVKYANPVEDSVSSAQITEPTQQTVSGVTADTTPAEISSTPASSKEEPASSAPVKEPEAKPSSAPAKDPEPAKPAAAKPAQVTYSFPVGNSVTKNFSGENPIFSDTMQDWRVHEGLDLAAKNGTAVTAIADGTVADSFVDNLLGNVLVIEHPNNVMAYYCGLGDTLLVKKGASVTAGQKIGSVTTVPSECLDKPHLHLEVKKDGQLVDPLTLLK